MIRRLFPIVFPIILLALSAAALEAAPADAPQATKMTVKPTAGIHMDATVTGAVRVGDAGAVEITVSAAVPLTDLRVTIGQSPQIAVVSIEGRDAVDLLPAGEPLTLHLGIVVLEPGRHLLPVFVEARSLGSDVARSIVVPVRVDGEAAVSAAPVTKSDGVRSMRAVETVR